MLHVSKHRALVFVHILLVVAIFIGVIGLTEQHVEKPLTDPINPKGSFLQPKAHPALIGGSLTQLNVVYAYPFQKDATYSVGNTQALVILKDIDAAPAVNFTSVYDCPMQGYGSLRLRFSNPDLDMSITPSGCKILEYNHNGYWMLNNDAFWNDLQESIGQPISSN